MKQVRTTSSRTGRRRWGLVAGLLGVVMSCVALPPGARAEILIAVTTDHTLVGIDTSNAGSPVFTKQITGVAANQALVGLDYRPSDGRIYAVAAASNSGVADATFTSQLYTISPNSGMATPLGGPITPGLEVDNLRQFTSFGMDFNPNVDAIRVISDLNQNIVVNANTGALSASATDVFYAMGDVNQGVDPNIVDVAYNNNVAGAASTQQFGIDSLRGVLVTVANNAGTLRTVGPLNVAGTGGTLLGQGGFDISGETGTAFAVLSTITSGGQVVQGLYTVNLSTGAATQVAVLPPNQFGLLDGLTTLPARAAFVSEGRINVPILDYYVPIAYNFSVASAQTYPNNGNLLYAYYASLYAYYYHLYAAAVVTNSPSDYEAQLATYRQLRYAQAVYSYYAFGYATLGGYQDYDGNVYYNQLANYIAYIYGVEDLDQP